MLPTVAEVLALPALAAGGPRVLAGEDHLDNPVRWAHVAEIADISGLLRGDELILTTGVALPRTDDGLGGFVRELAEVPVAGLVVELGRTYAGHPPAAMVRAARQAGLPLVALRLQVPFVEVTESVHSLVIDGQLAQLRRAEALHDTFTELAVEGADVAEVVRQAARMAGASVVLETLGHQVVEHEPLGEDAARLLHRWTARSRAVRVPGRSGHDPASGWLVATVGARGDDWGRLVLVRGPGEPPQPQDLMLLERAATTLALHQLIARDREGLERQTHRTLIAALLDHAHPHAEIGLRAGALGVTLEGRRLVGAVVRPRTVASTSLSAQARMRDLADAVAQATRTAGVAALVGTLDDRTVGVLAALERRDDDTVVLGRVAAALSKVMVTRPPGTETDLVLAAGSVVAGLREARRTVLEAGQAADAAAHLPPTPHFVRMPETGLRGLLSLLRGDARVATFVERQLGPLLESDHPGGSGDGRRSRLDAELLPVLRAYLATGRNKSLTAAELHLSRPALYDRLTRLEQVLGVDLDDTETCLGLHVALLAAEVS
ncbi:MAG TPA: PucR family transcriptional regulator ligand-binding domain-containing protein [Actinomycetales bacterium]|nr:PucR family transcriptional regulator ligand-binding domain-containing protein [Actinomycetales bacterium]